MEHPSAGPTISTRPHTTRRKHKAGVHQERKRTVKYLSVCRSPKAFSAVINSSPDSVIKSICDAAINVHRNKNVPLTSQQRRTFRAHESAIHKLTQRGKSIASKRKIIKQKGGAFWIPALIGAALGGLGSTLFGARN